MFAPIFLACRLHKRKICLWRCILIAARRCGRMCAVRSDRFPCFLYLQITCTMVALWHHLRWARRRKFGRYGLLNNHIVPDATLCYHINCLFPVEDEQRLRIHNVSVIFRFRCHFAVVRVRLVHMSTLKRTF